MSFHSNQCTTGGNRDGECSEDEWMRPRVDIPAEIDAQDEASHRSGQKQ